MNVDSRGMNITVLKVSKPVTQCVSLELVLDFDVDVFQENLKTIAQAMAVLCFACAPCYCLVNM